MGFLNTIFEILGFAIGLLLGLIVGFYLFIYSAPKDVDEPAIKRLHELDTSALQEILREVPPWIKSPDYHRVYWLNKFILDMWPYLNRAICGNIKSTAEPRFGKYIGKYKIEAIEFEKLSLGTLPPTIHGMKVYKTNEKELVMEPVIRWAGNPNIVVCLRVLSLHIKIQLVDLQIFTDPRIKLKPLVPIFPCFANIMVSLMEKPRIDFGMKILGGDIMSIPGLYRFVQETIHKQIANMCLWPQTLELPILGASTGATTQPVGILHVKLVRATKLLTVGCLGASDHYVKLELTGDRHPEKTTIKMNNSNPEWNENFKFLVEDPQCQALLLQVYQRDKVGSHNILGMQLVRLNLLKPLEKKEFVVELMNCEDSLDGLEKHTDINDYQNKKERGQLVVELTFVPFREESGTFNGLPNGNERIESRVDQLTNDNVRSGAGLLSVIVRGAKDVEGERHNNPYVSLIFRGEKKKTRMLRKTRDPIWDEEFQFILDEPPLQDKIYIAVKSKRTGVICRSKESLGYVQINLDDVVHNRRINEKYDLIDSKNGVIHVETRWTTV